MFQINLLPWRSAFRLKRQRAFSRALAGVILMALSLVAAWSLLAEAHIDNQRQRVALLERELRQLDQQIKDQEVLGEQLLLLKEQIHKAQVLESSKITMVRHLNGLAHNLVDGVAYLSLRRSGNLLNLEGIATSGSHVAELLRKLQVAPWLVEARLIHIDTSPAPPAPAVTAKAFKIQMVEADPVLLGSEDESFAYSGLTPPRP